MIVRTAQAHAGMGGGLLRRKCACGGPAGLSGECEACRKKKLVGAQFKLRINAPGDEFEREADRMAEAVTNGGASTIALQPGTRPRIQRQEKPSETKPEDEEKKKYGEAAGKAGEAFLKTELGKKITDKAKEMGEAAFSTLPGTVITGSIAAGAVAGMAATGTELPFQPPEIPLDKLRPGLKMQITYEGPVNKPTKAMITFSGTWERPSEAKKPTATEKTRAETAKLSKELHEFRESMKTPEQKAAEKQEFWNTYWRMRSMDPLNPLNLPGVTATPPAGLERKKEEQPVQRKESGPGEARAISANEVDDVVKSSGTPLDEATRAFMESRFGHDFSQVRVHDDSRADESARSVNALAYTVGHHLVFAGGQYQPRTASGQRLLAHELTHVAQQAAAPSSAPAIQCKGKPKAPKKPFYQEALKTLEEEKKARVTLSTGGVIDIMGRVPVIEKFVALAEAVDKGNTKDIPELLDDFLKADTTRLPIGFPSDPLVNTMVSRLLLLGLGETAENFRKWYLKHEQQQGTRPHLAGKFLSDRFLWEQVLEELTGQIPERGADAALKVLDALLLLFKQMRDEAAGLDEEAIKKDREKIRSISAIVDLPIVRDVTISVYYDSLMELLKGAFTSIQAAYQVVLDQAIEDLGAGKGSKFLEAARIRLDRLRGLIDPVEEKKKSTGMTVEVTASEFKEKGSKHIDIFAKDKAASRRTIGIEFYDKELGELMGEEKKLSFARIFVIRRNQIALLERIYGLEKDKAGALTAETKENAAAIEKLGKTGLRLQNDDDWRKFLLEKFEARRAKDGPAEAFTAVIKLLESFLQTFTTHTPYNIEDFGDNHLTKEFPRALTGQLIHDCGVYALRIAYMLSLLRGHKDLKLRFRFIVLPVHVGLIITGDGLPAYIAHNDRVVVFSSKNLSEIREAWIRTDEQGNPQPPAARTDEDQLLAELAGQEFISGVDLPYALLEVPEPKGGEAKVKRDLWSHYTRKVARTELFGPVTNDPKSEFYQYHLRYLNVLERMKAHWNGELVPFWNGARKTWLKHEPALSKAFAKLNAAKAGKEQEEAREAYDKLVEGYLKEIEPRFQSVDNKFQPILVAQLEIVATLNDHPEIIKKGVPVTRSGRVQEVFRGPWWSRDFNDHRSDLMLRKNVWAPFAKPEDQIQPID